MRLKHIFLKVLLSAALVFPAGIFAKNIGKLAMVIGKVEVREGKGKWKKARIGMPVTTTMSINTGFKSKAVVRMSTGTRLTLKPSTMIKFSRFTKGNYGTATDVNLRTGRMKSVVAKLQKGKRNYFRVRTPTAVAGVRGSGSFDKVGAMGFKRFQFEHTADVFGANGARTSVAQNDTATAGGGPDRGRIKPPDLVKLEDAIILLADPSLSDEQIDAIFDSFDQAPPEFGDFFGGFGPPPGAEIVEFEQL